MNIFIDRCWCLYLEMFWKNLRLAFEPEDHGFNFQQFSRFIKKMCFYFCFDTLFRGLYRHGILHFFAIIGVTDRPIIMRIISYLQWDLDKPLRDCRLIWVHKCYKKPSKPHQGHQKILLFLEWYKNDIKYTTFGYYGNI